MKYMITGGNRGLGQALCARYNGDSYSRNSGYDITKDREKLVEASLQYDVFVNNAFDGPFQESWADFAQVKLLFDVATAWKNANKVGHIINIGSSGSESIVAPDPAWETYRVSKAALKHHSLQWTHAFKTNQTPFRTSLITLDRLDTALSRGRPNWTGNGIDLSDVGNMIDTCVSVKNNTCIGEITVWVNFDA